jgi:hypothetical protein
MGLSDFITCSFLAVCLLKPLFFVFFCQLQLMQHSSIIKYNEVIRYNYTYIQYRTIDIAYVFLKKIAGIRNTNHNCAFRCLYYFTIRESQSQITRSTLTADHDVMLLLFLLLLLIIDYVSIVCVLTFCVSIVAVAVREACFVPFVAPFAVLLC